jgi:hypothetical protein
VRALAAVVSLALLGACGADPPPAIEIYATGADRPVIDEMVRFVPYDRMTVAEAADPAAALGGGLSIAVVSDLDCTDCYRLEQTEQGYVVHGDEPLGIQYGLAHMLESLGFRFYHPWYTYVPKRPTLPDSLADAGTTFEPERSRRGLHLHTIHPIEPYYAFWEPGAERLADAERIVDWMVKNRANYVQWVGLDDVQQPGADAEPWRDHTRAIIDYAHGRGVDTGLGIQLFGQSNLQQGFDLIDSDDPEADPRPAIEARLGLITDLGFDLIDLSFGEFFGADPDRFVATVNLVFEVLRSQDPDAEMGATVHVGDSEDLRVSYMGEELLYYFLVKFADPGIVPWVHTVMYYNLFEDAGGAYHHEDFAEHRSYLIERIDAGLPVAYFPETAYWIAFDNSVPTYTPLYVRSRWLDLAELRAAASGGDLDQHVLFSSGWEWGYWQNDYASLRASYRLPAGYGELFDDMFAPFGDAGAEVAAAVTELADRQAEALIADRLAAYFAARDLYIDLGDEVDIVSQPDRVRFEEAAGLDAAGRRAFEAEVMAPLAAVTADIEAILDRLRAVDLEPGSQPWLRELIDGVEIDLVRGQYVAALYRAALAQAAGDDPSSALAEADRLLDRGSEIVARRHGDLYYPRPDELLYGTTNATYYQWGYLKQTHELCYWVRERVELARLTEQVSEPVPACVY